jgi:hypothetical protein
MDWVLGASGAGRVKKRPKVNKGRRGLVDNYPFFWVVIYGSRKEGVAFVF